MRSLLVLAVVLVATPVVGQTRSRIAVLAEGHRVRLLDETGARLTSIDVSGATDVALGADGRRVAILAEGYRVRIFDESGGRVSHFDVEDGRALDISRRAERVAVLTLGYRVGIFDSQGRRLRSIDADDASDVALSADGKRLAILGQGYRVRIFDADDGQRLASFDVDAARAVSLSGDGDRVAVLAEGGRIRIHDGRGRRLATFDADRATDVALTDDGTRVVALCLGHRVRILTAEGRAIRHVDVDRATRVAAGSWQGVDDEPAPQQAADERPDEAFGRIRIGLPAFRVTLTDGSFPVVLVADNRSKVALRVESIELHFELQRGGPPIGKRTFAVDQVVPAGTRIEIPLSFEDQPDLVTTPNAKLVGSATLSRVDDDVSGRIEIVAKISLRR